MNKKLAIPITPDQNYHIQVETVIIKFKEPTLDEQEAWLIENKSMMIGHRTVAFIKASHGISREQYKYYGQGELITMKKHK